MATAAIPGMETKLYIDRGSADWDLVLGVRSISGFGGDREAIDVTNTSSSDNAKEYLPGLMDNGSFNCEVNYDPDSAGDTSNIGHDRTTASLASTNLAGFFEKSVASTTIAECIVPMKIVFFDTSYVTFSGFVKSMKVNAATEGKLTLNLTIQITGKITWPA